MTEIEELIEAAEQVLAKLPPEQRTAAVADLLSTSSPGVRVPSRRGSLLYIEGSIDGVYIQAVIYRVVLW